MKKFAACFFSTAMVLCGITAFAAESEQDVYFGSDNSVHIAGYNSDVSQYTTVLIRKSETEGANGVVYVDQQSKGFSDVVDFMLKSGTANGEYVATFGNANEETKKVKFFVGEVEINGKDQKLTLDRMNKMSVADEPVLQEGLYGEAANGTYKKGFVFSATEEQYNSFNRLYLVSADAATCYGYFELEKETTITGGEVAYGIQIYNIPVDRLGMNLYLGGAGK